MMMSDDVRWFIRSALVWLVLGVSLGLTMAVAPKTLGWARPIHLHMNLLGFVTLMIFGVAYHVLPRFTGIPMRSEKLMRGNLILSNLGLMVLLIGWFGRYGGIGPGGAATVFLASGAAIAGAGALLFVVNVWGMLTRPRALEDFRVPVAPPCGGGSMPGAGDGTRRDGEGEPQSRLIQIRRGGGR
jgi:hypothetical protein